MGTPGGFSYIRDRFSSAFSLQTWPAIRQETGCAKDIPVDMVLKLQVNQAPDACGQS
jgi:hypothetical protein